MGSRADERGLLCGFVFQIAGNSGVPGLRASESYCRPAAGLADPSCSVIHALRDQYLLQLDQVRTELFIFASPVLENCRRMLTTDELEQPVHKALRRLLRGIGHLTLHPCTKGRFFDSMVRKLRHLATGHSNEVTAVDFSQIVTNVLG